MNQPPHHTFVNHIMIKNLQEKSTEFLYNYQFEGNDKLYQNQKIFHYETAIADPNLRKQLEEMYHQKIFYKTAFTDPVLCKQEELYASYTPQQQAEFVEMFSCVVEKISHLAASDASQQEIEHCIALSYEKLKPLVWRVHLLWFLRKKTCDLWSETLSSILNCAPCKIDTLKAIAAFALAAYYYYVILFTMPWSENNNFAGERYVIPITCVLSCFLDLILTPLNQYSQAKTFINDKFKKYTVWKIITNDLARTVEKTYQPL